jgi:hypothetical protein
LAPKQRSDDHLQEALKSQYVLRSLFLHRKLREKSFQELIAKVEVLDASALQWDLAQLHISKTAFDYISKTRIKPTKVFCHPNVLIQDQRLATYYRGLSGISQKGISKLSVNTAPLEEGRVKVLMFERALKISQGLNRIISTIIDGDINYSLEDARRLLLAAIGITFDGSWRNEVGETATRQVQEMLLKFIAAKKLFKGKKSLEADIVNSRITPAPVLLKNDWQLIFSTDPDVGIYDKKSQLKVAIEVKGGIDDAGALERYGAARKSFDKARRENVRCTTIYLASCVTQAVQERIEQDGLVSQIWNLTNILLDEQERQKFLKELFKYQVRLDYKE